MFVVLTQSYCLSEHCKNCCCEKRITLTACEKSSHTQTRKQFRDCSVLKDTELFIECVWVPSLGVADWRAFTAPAVVHITPRRNMFFFSSSSVIVHFLLAMHFYHQIINFLKCWKKCLFLTTSSCLIIRLHSPRSMCTTRVLKTRCVFTRCWEETMGGHSTSLIKRNHVLILWTEMDYINVAVIVRILYLTDK